jgi:hypothetical protein
LVPFTTPVCLLSSWTHRAPQLTQKARGSGARTSTTRRDSHTGQSITASPPSSSGSGNSDDATPPGRSTPLGGGTSVHPRSCLRDRPRCRTVERRKHSGAPSVLSPRRRGRGRRAVSACSEAVSGPLEARRPPGWLRIQTLPSPQRLLRLNRSADFHLTSLPCGPAEGNLTVPGNPPQRALSLPVQNV